MNKPKIMELLPKLFRDSDIYISLFSEIEKEIDRLGIDIEDIRLQLNIETATWGLSIYEKKLGLPIAPDLDYETRWSIVRAKNLMISPGSKNELLSVIRSFVEDAEIVEHFSEYKFDVILSTKNAIGDKLVHIASVVEMARPAHLDYLLVISYIADLLFQVSFSKYNSEKLLDCGIQTVGGEEHISTLGKVHKEIQSHSVVTYIGDDIPTASENGVINGTGWSHGHSFDYLSQSILGEGLEGCSEHNVFSSTGSVCRGIYQYFADSHVSTELLFASESVYCGEVI